MEVNDAMTTPVLGGASPQPAWLEVMSPSVGADEMGVTTPASSNGGSTLVGSEGGKSRLGHGEGEGAREMPPPSSGISYAVAIYPYMAEQEDEFDVIVCVLFFHSTLSLSHLPILEGTPS